MSYPSLRNLLYQVKGKTLPEDRLGIVYGTPCNCLSVRSPERAVRLLDMRNALATHIFEHPDHEIEWKNSNMFYFNLGISILASDQNADFCHFVQEALYFIGDIQSINAAKVLKFQNLLMANDPLFRAQCCQSSGF